MSPGAYARYITQDYRNNSTFKIRLVLMLYRWASLPYRLNTSPLMRPFYIVINGIYRILTDWVLGIDIPARTEIGSGLRIYHGYGIVIGAGSRIGINCTLRHGVTIGNRIRQDGSHSDDPVIADNVEFGANAAAIGAITVGANSLIGIGAVLTESVPAHSRVLVAKPEIRRPATG